MRVETILVCNTQEISLLQQELVYLKFRFKNGMFATTAILNMVLLEQALMFTHVSHSITQTRQLQTIITTQLDTMFQILLSNSFISQWESNHQSNLSCMTHTLIPMDQSTSYQAQILIVTQGKCSMTLINKCSLCLLSEILKLSLLLSISQITPLFIKFESWHPIKDQSVNTCQLILKILSLSLLVSTLALE